MYKIEWSCKENILGGGEFSIKRLANKEFEILKKIALHLFVEKGVKSKVVFINYNGEIERVVEYGY